MKKAHNFFNNIILLILTLLILSIFMEIILRVTYNLYSDYNTEMWRYASKVKMFSTNPLVSHIHKPNVTINLYGADIKTNSEGWRGREYNKIKDNYTIRIMILGDSLTLGWGVKYNETFPQKLEFLLNNYSKNYNYEVINLGVGNYNTQMEVESFKDNGLNFKPDIIILAYYINDAEPTYKKESYLNIVEKNSYIYAFFWDKYAKLKSMLTPSFNYSTFYRNLYKEENSGKIVTKNYLNEIMNISKTNNIPLIVMVFPEFHEFKKYEFQYVTDFVKENTKGAIFLDLLPYYIPYNPRFLWVSYEDAHPNGKGHDVAAINLFETLINKNLIPIDGVDHVKE